MAGSVLVTVGSVWSKLRPELVAQTSRLRTGDGSDPDVDVGPVISPAARDRILACVEQALGEGAELALDGRASGPESAGAFVGPTIIEHLAPGSEAVREEIFGPVLSVVEVGSLDEAIELVNASRYGNGTSIFTESGGAARHYRAEVQAGMVGVNVGVAAPVAFFPFSGWKASFLGDLHAHGQDAIEFFTRKKTITSRWFSVGESGPFFVE